MSFGRKRNLEAGQASVEGHLDGTRSLHATGLDAEEEPMPPHNLTMTFAGTAMLWVGRFGFNAGSNLGANGGAAMTLPVTHISAATATATATATWMIIEWIKNGKPSVLGPATGAIAGLAAVTPASGFIGPVGGLVIGLTSGVVCYWTATSLKNMLGYDDSLGVFGVFGVGGFIGTILVAVFAASTFGGSGGDDYSIGSQLGVRALAAVVTIVYTLVISFILLKLTDKLVGLRVSEDAENEGLDVSDHGEAGYNY